jgi:1,2-phenylacetyl-CoA epoxidase PaaB subunit
MLPTLTSLIAADRERALRKSARNAWRRRQPN